MSGILILPDDLETPFAARLRLGFGEHPMLKISTFHSLVINIFSLISLDSMFQEWCTAQRQGLFEGS